jgi:hypothetical protein
MLLSYTMTETVRSLTQGPEFRIIQAIPTDTRSDGTHPRPRIPVVRDEACRRVRQREKATIPSGYARSPAWLPAPSPAQWSGIPLVLMLTRRQLQV